MATLENVFSWSKSRDEEFQECQRKYFYDRYASWGGWDRSAPAEARLAYVLKNLKNRWAWKGETVHHIIEDVLKSIRGKSPLSLEEATARLTETMRRDYRSSKTKKYYDDPKRSIGLFEHEYEKPVPDPVWKETHDSAAACLGNFYRSELYLELLKDDTASWLVIEDLEEFDLEGAKVFVKLDFARKKNGVVEIYDWKTGKMNETDARVQIGVYVLYVMDRWGVGLENIRAYLFSLAAGQPKPEPYPVTRALIDETRETVRVSIERMRELLLDPKKNIPLPRENFSFTQNTRFCSNCNFYKMCEKYKTS